MDGQTNILEKTHLCRENVFGNWCRI